MYLNILLSEFNNGFFFLPNGANHHFHFHFQYLPFWFQFNSLWYRCDRICFTLNGLPFLINLCLSSSVFRFLPPSSRLTLCTAWAAPNVILNLRPLYSQTQTQRAIIRPQPLPSTPTFSLCLGLIFNTGDPLYGELLYIQHSCIYND